MSRLRTMFLIGATAVAVAALAMPTADAAKPETANPGAAAATEHAHVDMPLAGRPSSGLPDAAKAAARPARITSNGISFHNGPVMTSGVNAYVIWYGDWSGNSGTTIIPALLTGLNGSPYYNINTTYYDASKAFVPNKVTMKAQTFDGGSQGTVNLSDAAIQNIVSTAISSGALGAADPNGLYFVLTSAKVTKTGFLTQYCGWHSYATIATKTIKYSFVGDPGSNTACNVQPTVSPNGNPGVDAMASVIAHELEETATDPQLNAWFDSRGYENADKCAWTFGTTSTLTNGAKYNVTLGGLKFYIQRNWVNAAGGYCAMSY